MRRTRSPQHQQQHQQQHQPTEEKRTTPLVCALLTSGQREEWMNEEWYPDTILMANQWRLRRERHTKKDRQRDRQRGTDREIKAERERQRNKGRDSERAR